MAPRIGISIHTFIRVALASAALMPGLLASAAIAQDGALSTGDALTTQFSGFASTSDADPLPDPDGVTVRALRLGNPGFAADGSIWPDVPEGLALTARQTGQVFATTFDDQSPADAYVAATSAFGLYRSGDGWAPGMWGEGGGPGTIWKLEAANGYSPVPFANVTGDGTDNGGAGLGGLTFDPWNRQLFAADLESGLIHRIDLATGETVQTFDHGLDGRSYFLDVPSGQYLVLDVIPDVPGEPRYQDCTDASGAAAPFWRTPECWNYADFRRRVWGLGVQRDPVTDQVRLYYAVWGGAALGADGWETAGDDAATTVWSVRLDGNGGFDLTDVQREFVVPPLVPQTEGGIQAESPPVTDIAFSSDGAMVLAERGRPAPDLQGGQGRLVQPDSARVMLFIRNDDGVWEPEGRYDAGFPERGPDSAPYIRANAAGGLALGDGYTDDGDIDPEAPDSTVWMSADPLCAPNGPCIDRQSGQATVQGPLGGIQGSPISATTDLVPPAAIQDYPSGGGPVTQPQGLLEAYLVPTPDTGSIIGAMGDVAIYRAEAPTQIVELPEEVPQELIEELPPEVVTPDNPLPDLAVAKTGLGRCAPGSQCVYQISVTNRGPVDYNGPILLTDTIGAPNVSLAGATGDQWDCFAADGNIYCQYPATTLAPGASLSFALTLQPGANHSEPRLNNCAAVTWLGLQGRDRIRAVQAELKRRGYDPGSVDGIMGPNTSNAIRSAEAAAGLPATGQINPTFIEALYGPGANQDGDASPGNDQDCAIIPVDVPPPSGHQVQVSGFHRKFDSLNHDQTTSAPVQFHDLDLSYFHRTWQSSLHDVSYSQPIPIHRVALSQFHLTWGSGLHDGIYTRLVPIHSVSISGFHDSFQSIQHDYYTSSQVPFHRPALSSFHRSWNSQRHDGIVTRIAPLHWVQLSAFHRRFASGLHDNAVTRLRPVHGPSLSNFHNFNQSSLHDPLTSRVRPIHQPAVSNFHSNGISAQHSPATSRPRPDHFTNLSSFHRTFVSNQHEPLTTRLKPVHNPSVSNFHSNGSSAVHSPLTSQPRDIHLLTMSNYHRTNPSASHNPATTSSRPVHAPSVSTFHRNGQSRLHNSTTSQAAPVHAPAISTFHRTGQSGLHNSASSQGQSPSHQLGLSNFHRSSASTLHNNRTSQGTSPSHNPALSNFHRNGQSDQHRPQTSSAMSPGQPIHSDGVSRAVKPVVPTLPAHNPAVSRNATQPAHNPARSDADRQPAHNSTISAQVSPPRTPNQPNVPKPPVVPTHDTNASRAATVPSHNTNQSQSQSRPQQPAVPTHNTNASRAATVPSHSTSQSQSQSRPQQPAVPTHNTNASRAATVPSHSTSQSQSQSRPQQPAVPTHNPNVSRAATVPRVPAHDTARSQAANQPRPSAPQPVAPKPAAPKPAAPKPPAPAPAAPKQPAVPSHNSSVSQAQDQQKQMQQQLLKQQQQQQQQMQQQLQKQQQQQQQQQQQLLQQRQQQIQQQQQQQQKALQQRQQQIQQMQQQQQAQPKSNSNAHDPNVSRVQQMQKQLQQQKGGNR
ncbi:peptidoglycan-binding domain-containing protein [Microbaculum marinum]|uniref:Peptidoglycan-binding protein n=1 Tax=Microbaculum marinum TaxID=1764581 RepID=A0AAW9RWG8_9HYPH